MLLNKYTALIAGALSIALIQPVISETTAPAAAKTGYGSCDAADNASLKLALDAMVDPEVMAQTMADPAKFNQFMSAMMNPANIQTISSCSTSSDYWQTAMNNMANPTKFMNASAQFMNPAMYSNWMTAMMNPQTYQFMYSFMNPSYYMNWMTASMNPATYQPMFGMMGMMDPSKFMAQATPAQAAQ